MQHRMVGRHIARVDGPEKATGRLEYMSDITVPGMLYGKILLSPYHRAEIVHLDHTEAMKVRGVVKVVTADDIPGENARGLIIQDQPVLCDRFVNFKGDAVAVVVAESEEAALEACSLIQVDYRELPYTRTAEESLEPGAPEIHEGGNIAARNAFSSTDDIESVFARAPHVFDETFETGYQEHAYLEAENGFAVPREDGSIEIWYGCQHGHRARRDLQAILDLPLEKIEVHSHPLGGGFGGKDDLLLQGILAVCALACRRPVAINLTREESFRMSPKRMPFQIRTRIAADAEGNLLALKVNILGTAGAYMSYAPAILDFALELCTGIYFFPHLDIEGRVAYTNSHLVSAFRGFGNIQVAFAIESMMDIIAERLQLDKLELRRRNMVTPGQKHSFGNVSSTSYYSQELIDRVEKSALLNRAGEFKAGAAKPWLKRGIGIATTHQGMGFGSPAINDASTCEVELREDGRLHVFFGNEDMGQGSITTLLIMAAEAMHMPIDQISYTNGNTALTQDSGPITASRVTYVSGKAVCRCIEKLQGHIASVLSCEVAELSYTDGGVNGRSWQEIAGMLPPGDRRQAHTEAIAKEGFQTSVSLNLFYCHAALVAGVEVNTLTGETMVLETEIIVSSGTVINPLGYEGQCEGGVLMSQGFALTEEYQDGTRNFQTYMVPTFADMPEIKVTPIEDPEETGPYGAKGLGEIVNVPGAPAIINAVHDAVGIRLMKLPATSQSVLTALTEGMA